MRVIRTIDPLSGKVMQKKISLSSTSGVSVSQHEELPKSELSDVTIASNQLTRAVYDVRDTMRETNVINYEISRKLKKGIDGISDSETNSAIAIRDAINSNTDALGSMREELQDFKSTDAIVTSSAMQNISSSIDESSRGLKDTLSETLDSTNDLLGEIASQDRNAADNMTVTIGDQTMSVNDAFTEIFSLLSGLNDKIDQLTLIISPTDSGD